MHIDLTLSHSSYLPTNLFDSPPAELNTPSIITGVGDAIGAAAMERTILLSATSSIATLLEPT